MSKNIYLNILLVFLCLYTFLIGIKGLSSAINKISSPDEIFPGDQVQLKYILVDEEKIKKAWVEVQTEPDQNGDFSFLYRGVGEVSIWTTKEFFIFSFPNLITSDSKP